MRSIFARIPEQIFNGLRYPEEYTLARVYTLVRGRQEHAYIRLPRARDRQEAYALFTYRPTFKSFLP